jgi:hypothetical protein
MTLHKLKTGERDWSFFYARNPYSIIELVTNYRRDNKLEERMAAGEILQSCFMQNPGLRDIIEVERGKITYIPTRLYQPKPILKEFHVSDEFVVFMPEKAVELFRKHAKHSLSEKRGDLYKLNLEESIKSQNYLPEDIVKVMINCDYKSVRSDATRLY